MPTFISLTSPIVGYCHRCRLPIHEHDQVCVATDDDLLCPYYNARKLVFCSQDCLEKQMEFVLEQLRTARQKYNQSNQKETQI